MAKVLLLTNSTSVEVLPSLSLLQHQVRIQPLISHALMSDSDVECLLIDARKDMQSAKSLVKFIEATGNSIPLIVIATEGSLSAISADWGMSDVILDTAGPAEVEARIRIVCGRKPISQNLNSDSGKEIRSGAISIDEVSYTARIKGKTLDLTFKEFELLKYFAQHPGRVLTRSQLLQEIWGYDYFGGTRTVDVHIRRLRSKLGAEFESIIETVRNVGYKYSQTSQSENISSN